MLLALSSLAFPCTWYVYDDYGDGSTDGHQYGGTFVTGGWRPDGGSIVYDLPELQSATITMRLSNVDERDVSQHDLLEMFTSSGGTFSDGTRDNFLQVKFAGDIYDGYDGRVKLQAGPEWYGTTECGAWTAEFDWDPSGSYDFTVSFDATSAWLDIAGVLSSGIDASPCQDIGPLSFRTLMVPNDGSYARDSLMDDIVIAGVAVCGEEAVVDDGGGGSGDGGGDSGDGGGGGFGDDTATDTSTAPVVATFAVEPPVAEVGEGWVVWWGFEGALDTARFCFRRDGAALETCADLQGASGRSVVSTADLAPGDYEAWIQAEGPGGDARSGPTLLSLRAAASSEQGRCSTGGRPGSLALPLLLAFGALARRSARRA